MGEGLVGQLGRGSVAKTLARVGGLTVEVNNVTLSCHFFETLEEKTTGLCNHHLLMNGSQRLTFQARKTVPITPITPIGTVCAGGVLRKYSTVEMYMRKMGVRMTCGRNEIFFGSSSTFSCARYKTLRQPGI